MSAAVSVQRKAISARHAVGGDESPRRLLSSEQAYLRGCRRETLICRHARDRVLVHR